MKKTRLALSALLLVLLLAACAPSPAAAPPAPQAPAPAAIPVPAPSAAPATPARPAWEVEWERTVDAAKKEGKVVVLTSTSAQVSRAVTEAFRSQFGIGLEFVAGTAAELSTKLIAQRRAGLYVSDVGIMGSSAPYTLLKPAGVLERVEPLVLLPELTDPRQIRKVLRVGELDWVDQDHTLLAFASYVKVAFVLNTDLVKPGEIKAYRDLLNPKWKGRIVMGDPTLGSGIASSAMQVLPNIVGWDYMRKLVEQQPVLNRDKRQPFDWVALGKYPVGLFLDEAVTKQFVDIGAPIAASSAEEGSYTVGGSHVISVMRNTAHPSSTRLLINWLLSKEGQQVYCSAAGAPSSRIDVSIEGLLPGTTPDPDKKYLRTNTEQQLLNMPETMKIVQEIFAPLKK